ncbi:hypothetical protein F4777DRAFT_540672 [Nemania sp. FL0916]|nr:hypothetical protein F4777DRAFT_540672 [Nemania sp. FL0916]
MSISYFYDSNNWDEAAPEFRRRVLLDIRELVTKPYPGITLHPNGHNIRMACLVLDTKLYDTIHLTVNFPPTYPIRPPKVTADSSIYHPNVFGSSICAGILVNGEDYTPAYTLKGIAIQLLSFFNSDKLEHHSSGNRRGKTIDVLAFRDYEDIHFKKPKDTFFKCSTCRFGLENMPQKSEAPRSAHFHVFGNMQSNQRPNLGQLASPDGQVMGRIEPFIDRLPNATLLLIIDYLDDMDDLINFACAWPRISQLMREFGIIRQRGLQCFCLKKDYREAKLGVGVAIDRGHMSSEFDFISQEGYTSMNIRSSIHKIPFQYWLPLPISQGHWNKIKGDAHSSLIELASQLKPPSWSQSPSDLTAVQVISTFMNDIIIRLNEATDPVNGKDAKKSTLRHTSEKAIESYFHLFHLLVCLAIEDPDIVQQANTLVRNFESGKTSKTDCPSLGHMLIVLLISDVHVTEDFIKSVIHETITRNVVRVLDKSGANLPELSYMERDSVSPYRLNKTFQASRTSYNILMFSEVFRRIARPSHDKSLTEIRNELFKRCGAPPDGAASHLAAEIRRLRNVNDFSAFMREMGVLQVPTPTELTALLRDTVSKSMEKGYSRWAIVDSKMPMRIRVVRDPDVQLTEEERESVRGFFDIDSKKERAYRFFPDNPKKQDNTRGHRDKRWGKGYKNY